MNDTPYPDTRLLIGGAWREGAAGRSDEVINPADREVIGRFACAEASDLDDAVAAARDGFARWRATDAARRGEVLAAAADLLAQRTEDIARTITLEQGKPLYESRLELARAVDTFRWYAEQAGALGNRDYPERPGQVRQHTAPEPVGVVAAFTAWNFPAILPARKLAPALAAGCSVILKAAEETPATAARMADALADAGLPDGVLNLVYGDPAMISEALLARPEVRKLSFTGSVPVGMLLARQAAANLTRCTLELGGHAPVIVFADADVAGAARDTAAFKYRNAGQVCVAPSRFFIEKAAYREFVEAFADIARDLKVGDGLDEATQMGPMANERRIEAMERLVSDATANGAEVLHGGARHGERGYFWQPTVLTEVPDSALVMTEEPFGPVAPICAFEHADEVIERANSLPYGLASYLFTGSETTARRVIDGLETGTVGVNTLLPAQPDTPLGGVKHSGYGYEGGREGMDGFLHLKLVTQAPW